MRRYMLGAPKLPEPGCFVNRRFRTETPPCRDIEPPRVLGRPPALRKPATTDTGSGFWPSTGRAAYITH
jgi:hypothetical protein